jgi:peptidoglycan/xylan/chitin deacetylase (PgdA/CDA1 family)
VIKSAPAYEPSRDLPAQVARRLVRLSAARPANLSFHKPVVSFTFDDFPRSAVSIGARLLEHAGVRGTFYASAGLVDTFTHHGAMFAREDLERLRAAGHEIGCHTSGHIDAARAPTRLTLDDIGKNTRALRDLGVTQSPRSFAYPYGETTSALKAALPKRFTTARGIGRGVNVGPTDLVQLRANPMLGEDSLARGQALLREAVRRKGWVIFYGHDVGVRPSRWGTETLVLERLIGAALALEMDILPVNAVAARIPAND